jgi:copper chaperone NosL
MNRNQFSHSRIFIDYDDGSPVGTCSLHCAPIDLALHIDKMPRIIWVGEFNTKQLVDAKKVAWVIGGNKPGVMTSRAKWAFSSKGNAQAFVRENGGTLARFDEVAKAAYEDMYADTKRIRGRRKMRRQHAPEPEK